MEPSMPIKNLYFQECSLYINTRWNKNWNKIQQTLSNHSTILLQNTFSFLIRAENKKEDILNNMSNQAVNGLHWLPFYWGKIQWKSMGYSNFVVTHIRQNILFCVQKEKFMSVWKNLRVSKLYSFLVELKVNPFRLRSY